MARMSDAWLRRSFDEFNLAYFSGKIVGVRIRFGNSGRDANGVYDTGERLIVIDKFHAKRGNERHAKLDLLHEMVHAYLDVVDGYVGGSEKDPLHGTRFRGEICRLWQIGAYDGLL